MSFERHGSSPGSSFNICANDAVEWLGQFPTNHFDLALVDPPYESLEKHRAVGTTTRLKKRWFPIFENKRFPALMDELYRVLARNAHCYVFSDAETMPHLVRAGEGAGFKFWKPLVWDKVAIGMGYHYRARYEFILFFEKGKRKLNDLGVPDVLTFKRVRSDFPTEKPVELYKTLIHQSSNPGEILCDPFVGSGASIEAALYSDRQISACDVSTTDALARALRVSAIIRGEEA